jgi:hypothetical protein
MQIGQQENEAIRRDKTTIREGALQREQAQELLSQKLEADDVMFERTSEREDARTKAANEARRLEIQGQEGRANRAQLDKEARDNAEFNRRRKLGLDDRKELRTQAAAKNKGRIAGASARFDALRPQITNPDTLKAVEASFNKLKEALDKTTDPDEQEGLLSSIDDLLKPETLVRMTEGAAKAKSDSAPAPAPSPTGNTGKAPTPKNPKAKAAEAPASAPTSEARALNPDELSAAQGVLRALEGAKAPNPAADAANPKPVSPSRSGFVPDPSFTGGLQVDTRNLLGQRMSENYDLKDYMAGVLGQKIPTFPILTRSGQVINK